MARRWGARCAGAAVAVITLVAGCSSGGADRPDGGGAAAPSAGAGGDSGASAPLPGSRSPQPSGSAEPPAPESLPGTFEEALALARAVAAEPDVLGADFVRRSPYESAPRTVPVLDRSCRWQREALPHEVLAGLSRSSEVPGEVSGGGPLRVTAHVTVYRTTAHADAAMARFLEDALRCPDQRPRRGERVTSLVSLGEKPVFHDAEDSVFEVGQYTGAEHGGPHPYLWAANRVGSVVFAVSVKGADGYDAKTVSATGSGALGSMLTDVRRELR